MDRDDRPVDVLWEDGERLYRRIWRDTDDGGRREFLVAQPCAEHPTQATVNRLAHEYGLKDYLDPDGHSGRSSLVRERGQTMLVLEPTTSRPLDEIIGPGLPVETFLRLAIAVTQRRRAPASAAVSFTRTSKPATYSSTRQAVTHASLVSASPHAFRASASRSSRPSSSRERSPTWRRNRPGG